MPRWNSVEEVRERNENCGRGSKAVGRLRVGYWYWFGQLRRFWAVAAGAFRPSCAAVAMFDLPRTWQSHAPNRGVLMERTVAPFKLACSGNTVASGHRHHARSTKQTRRSSRPCRSRCVAAVTDTNVIGLITAEVFGREDAVPVRRFVGHDHMRLAVCPASGPLHKNL